MAKSLSMEQLKQLATHGARARLAELGAEIAAITRAFPDIADAAVATVTGRRRRRRRGTAAAAAATTPGRRRRRRGKLSAAGRAAILGGAEETLGGDQGKESREGVIIWLERRGAES